MSADYVPLAILMFAVTYPARTLPMLAPGLERLPGPVLTYLRLAGPAALAALAAVNALFATSKPDSFRLGIEPLAVVVCAVIVAWRRSLLPGVVVAAAMVAIARALGIA